MEKKVKRSPFINRILCILILILMAVSASADIPDIERKALIDLYRHTNGDNWTNNSGWKTPPLDSDGFAMPGTESNWYGVITETKWEEFVSKLYLDGNQLKGTIPDSLGNLENLQILNLNNNQLNGHIPRWSSRLKNLTDLRLAGNQLRTIHENIRNITNLTKLDLHHNELRDIPEWLKNMENLTTLNLKDNQLNKIPEWLGDMKNLTWLGLAKNEFTGTIPDSVKNLTHLTKLDLSYNKLQFIPEWIGDMISLTSLRLTANKLAGKIPDNITALENLKELDLSANNLYTHEPQVKKFLDTFHEGDFINTQYIATPPLPDSRKALINLYNATDGDYWKHNSGWKSPPLDADGFSIPGTESNWFGVCLENGVITELWLNNNQLRGNIPDSIGNLKNITQLNLSQNKLTGPIPDSIGEMTELTKLNLSHNELTGAIPEALGNLTRLRNLDLNYNQLTAFVPESIGNLTELTKCDLSHNQLTGTLPDTIGSLTKLTELDLRHNQLAEGIPDTIEAMTELTELNLRNNKLTGAIPKNITKLEKLIHIDLSGNQLSGPIPESIGNLKKLETLSLDSNQLNGPIPDNMAELINLTQLHLGYNELSGEIPYGIINLENLQQHLFNSRGLQLNGNQLYTNNPQVTNFLNCWHNGDFAATQEMDAPLTPNLPIPLNEREALIELYNTTNGDNWKHNDGWKTPPLGDDGFSMPGTEANWFGVCVKEGFVTELWLYRNQLTGTIPNTIGNLKNLTVLDLRGNQLKGYIPKEIGVLTKLTKLHLENNRLRGKIPAETGNLTKLKDLYFQNNNLNGEIPDTIKKLERLYDGSGEQNLYGLNLCGNRLFTENFSVKAFLDCRHENGNFTACQNTAPEEIQPDDLPTIPQFSRVLTKTTHSTEVKANEFVQIYGTSSGLNKIHVQKQGRVSLRHILGHNTIFLEEDSTDFMVWRSGATVYLESFSGTLVSLPATQTNQSIQFADDSFSLRIHDGKVMLNSQVVLLEKKRL